MPLTAEAKAALRRARGRYHALRPAARPADVRDLFTAGEALELARCGLDPRDRAGWLKTPPRAARPPRAERLWQGLLELLERSPHQLRRFVLLALSPAHNGKAV
jgi:hypothetical protein